MTVGETTTVSLITALLTAVIVAPSSAYLTTWLSLRRYQIEKWWDRKASAYENILGGMHDIIKYYDKTLEAHILDHNLSEAYLENLRANLDRGRADVQKIARMGAFILSDEAEIILNNFELEFSRASNTIDWYEYVENCLDTSLKTFRALRAEARNDLGVGPALPGIAWLEDRLERIRNRPGSPDLGGTESN